MKPPAKAPLPPEPPPTFLTDRIEQDAGKGVSKHLVDRAFWLGDVSWNLEEWVSALEVIDSGGSTEKLVELLRSDSPISERIRFYLADILQRFELKSRRGGRRTPAYNRSDRQMKLEMASLEWLEKKRSRDPVWNNSLKEFLAEKHGIGVEVFIAHLAGRRRQSRLVARRRPVLE